MRYIVYFGLLLSLITWKLLVIKLSSEMLFTAIHDLAEKMHGTQFASILRLNNQKTNGFGFGFRGVAT